MGAFIDLIGQKFGRLTAIKRKGTSKNGNANWLCLCKCGENTIVSSNNLQSMGTQSCGCLSREKTILRSTKHGQCKNNKQSRIYSSWCNMIKRCTNPNFKYYKNYGGRGITVCKRWSNKKNGFENFFKDMGNRSRGKSLDRINNNGNYNKINCKWSTPKEQSNNKRNNKKK
jgi:hypothetical protein